MKVLIIDDHPIIEEGLKSRILKILPNAEFFFADNFRNSLAITTKQTIGLVFCDLEFNETPEIDGFIISEKILEQSPTTKIIAHTNYNSYRIMKKVQESGFMSFLYKGCSFQDFSDTVLNVLQNGKYVSNSMKDLLKKREVYLRGVFSDSLYGISELSKRELELTILSKESTDRKILATKMGNTPSTIDSYFQHIITKLKLKNRAEVALFSLEFQEKLLSYKNNESK